MSDPAKIAVLTSDELEVLIERAVARALETNNGVEKWFYTSGQAEYLTGLPKTWLESAAKRGELKRVQFGHYKLFPREDLLRFAEEHKKRSEP